MAKCAKCGSLKLTERPCGKCGSLANAPTLPNLAALADAATRGPWVIDPHSGGIDGSRRVVVAPALEYQGGELFSAKMEWFGDDAALIAAAPEMAALLIAIYDETEEGGCAFDCAPDEPAPCTRCRIRARLADFDGRIG